MQEKQNIGLLFDHIANSYDTLNHLLSLNIDRYWRRRAVHSMHACTDVLDVAIGTADLTIEMLRFGKAKNIVGIDLSDEMMAIGRQKVAKKWPERVSFLHANAQNMPFENNRFDAVTCAYGARNFANLDEGLSEMFRVLKNGGELMILEFSYPTNRFVAWCYDVYFSHLLPWIGRIVSHDKTAYSYLNRSVKNFIWGEDFCEHLRKIGFTNITFTPLTFGITTIYRAIK